MVARRPARAPHRHTRRAAWVAMLAAAAVLVTACGFQLRGVVPLPPEMTRTYIDSPDRFSDLYRSLRRGLADNGVEVVDNRADADAVLRLRQEDFGERVLSVSARNIPREFEVYYIVDFQLEVNGSVRLDDQRIVQTRSYTWLETEVLGKAEESRRIRQALADDLVVRMLRRLSSVEDNNNGNPPPSP